MTTHIIPIPILTDNYAWLIREDDGTTAIVDPGEARPIERYLDREGLELDYILNTHHHGDHIAGNRELKSRYGAKVIGPAADAQKIYDLDIGVHEGHPFKLGMEEVRIMETPGHTLGGICFYLPGTKAIFTGDTLFSMGCGRLFEGSPEQMWDSLNKIMALPDNTNIYCGHEYTIDNGRFCLTVEPKNEALHRRMEEARVLRKEKLPTLPVTLATEKETNAFLRAGSAERFAELRRQKDLF